MESGLPVEPNCALSVVEIEELFVVRVLDAHPLAHQIDDDATST